MACLRKSPDTSPAGCRFDGVSPGMADTRSCRFVARGARELIAGRTAHRRVDRRTTSDPFRSLTSTAHELYSVKNTNRHQEIQHMISPLVGQITLGIYALLLASAG